MHRVAAPGPCWGLPSFRPPHRTPMERILWAPMIVDWNLDSLAITYYSGAWASSIYTCTSTTPRHKITCVHIYSSSSHETRWAPHPYIHLMRANRPIPDTEVAKVYLKLFRLRFRRVLLQNRHETAAKRVYLKFGIKVTALVWNRRFLIYFRS